MSKSDDRNLELKVGIFVLTGLLVAGGLVVQFGRLGEGLQKTYEVQVVFPDASGLYKGAEVLMSGARIGRVAASPHLLADQTGVLVYLSISVPNEIPKGSAFQLGTSGLLGDKFVQVQPPPPKERGGAMLQHGELVQGESPAGLNELTRDGREVLDELKLATQGLRELINRVNGKLLNDQNTGSIATTLQNIESSTRDLSAFTKKLDGWGTTAEKVLEDLSKASTAASGLMDGGNRLIRDLQAGHGLLATLLNDEKLSANVKALVENLRERGVLFYRDQSGSGRGGGSVYIRREAPAERGRPGRHN